MEVFKNQKERMIEFNEIKQKCDFPTLKYQKTENQSQFLQDKKEKIISAPSIENQILAILNSQFYLINIIGKGASGTVFLSYSIEDQKETKTLYAIKIINKKEPYDNCINNCEVDFLEKMNHKNILKVYGHGLGILKTPSGITQQVFYIIMDYLNHGSLLSQIDGNIGFGEDLGRLIFSQLLDGLEAIHDSNIVHRDIKLENIMLSGNDYTLKYVDFGFATEKSNGYLTTFLGTPNYAAPELHLKQPYLGVYEDIFSLGVTLFIIITGHLPFILPLPNDPLYQYIFCVDYINYWRKRNIKVSPSFMELFDNLIAFSPSQRPSISEIRNSKWMKEINLDLLPKLKEEFNKREEIKKNIIYAKQKMLQKKNINNNNNNQIFDNKKMKNADDILLKIKEEKKIEVINDIKRQLFFMSNTKGNNKSENNNITTESTEEIDDNINNSLNKKNELQGFINIKINFKNMNSLIILLRQFLKNEGYNITKKDLDNLNIEISNGEIDVLLSFEKMFKEIKIIFMILNGNKEDLINFKKIMKKFNAKK